MDNSNLPTITPEQLEFLLQMSGIKLYSDEIEPLCRVYSKLNRMKLLVRQPRSHSRRFAHIFELPSTQRIHDLG